MCVVCVRGGVGGGVRGRQREGQGTYPLSFSFGSWIALPVLLRSWLGYVLMRESTFLLKNLWCSMLRGTASIHRSERFLLSSTESPQHQSHHFHTSFRLPP